MAAVAATVGCALAAAPAAAQTPDPGGNADAPVPVPPPSGQYFGLNDDTTGRTHGFTSGQYVELAETAGANAIRGVLDWRRIEPERDRWTDATWGPFDELYARARTAGLTPIFVVAYAPTWARSLIGKLCLLGSQCHYPPRPEMDGEWAQLAAEAARRYPDAIFEIWNEPNLRHFWQDGVDPGRYARLQVVAYDAIKAVNPDAVVLSGGFAAAPKADLLTLLLRGMGMRDFVARAYQGGLESHSDALAFHPYPGPRPLGYSGPMPNLGAGSVYARAFDDIRAVRDANGDDSKPVFVTEIGISTTQGVTRADQVAATQRIYRKTLTMDDVSGIVFHRLVEPTHLLWSPLDLGFAWVRSAGYPPPPFPVYCAFVAAAGNSYPGC
jgi:hypothetical protein